MTESASERLNWLLRSYCGGQLDTQAFCRAFEQAFNLETDKRQLSDLEHAAFKKLFDEVVYFTPFPEEIKVYPRYRTGAQIEAAARDAQEKLASKISD
jgi:hypothetical protein